MAFYVDKMFFILLMSLVFESAVKADAWKKPGCHKIGVTRKISIPDCIEFSISANACRGYCQSWSIPSPIETLLLNPDQKITSIGQCCTIIDTEDVPITVRCLGGIKELTFKSAASCSCYHCKRY